MTKIKNTVKAFVAYNESNKTFVTYEPAHRGCGKDCPVPVGDVHLGGGLIASTNFRPKHVLATKPNAKRWADRANRCLAYYKLTNQGSYTCVEVTLSASF